MLCCIFSVRITAIQSTKAHSYKKWSLWNNLESAFISPHQKISIRGTLLYVNRHLLVHELALSNSTGTVHSFQEEQTIENIIWHTVHVISTSLITHSGYNSAVVFFLWSCILLSFLPFDFIQPEIRAPSLLSLALKQTPGYCIRDCPSPVSHSKRKCVHEDFLHNLWWRNKIF